MAIGLFICTSGMSVMNLSGPITANNVTVTGGVNVSSMTTSSLTVTNQFIVNSVYSIPGTIIQSKIVLSTNTLTSATTTFYPVDGLSQSITLSHSNNKIRISLSGTMASFPLVDITSFGYLTIFRDSTSLTSSDAFASALGHNSSFVDNPGIGSAGIVIEDSPGDTQSHTYQAFISSPLLGDAVAFPYKSTGVLLLEEVSD